MNYIRKAREKGVKKEVYEFVWGRREYYSASMYTLYTHLLYLQNWDILTQLAFIANIHEVNNAL